MLESGKYFTQIVQDVYNGSMIKTIIGCSIDGDGADGLTFAPL